MALPRQKRYALGIGAVVIGLVAWGVVVYVRQPRPTPELRGQLLAAELGCHGCHGAGGLGGVPNPLSDDKEIPAWDGGTAMMFVESDDDIREWILYGHRLRDAHDHETEADEAFPIKMPAYRDVVSDAQLENLVAYFKAVSNYRDIPAPARQGYRVAKQLGCFGCHGPGGLTGVHNARSFKGYIPPWKGSDFRELVRDEEELRAWINDGKIDRIAGNALGRWLLKRQVVAMPAYSDVLAPGDLDAIVAYINWLNE